jgi:hypothetical protein
VNLAHRCVLANPSEPAQKYTIVLFPAKLELVSTFVAVFFVIALVRGSTVQSPANVQYHARNSAVLWNRPKAPVGKG